MAGRASIGALSGGQQDLILDGETGWLLSTADQGLPVLLRRLANDSRQLEKAGRQAQKRASVVFSRDAQRQSLMRLLA